MTKCCYLLSVHTRYTLLVCLGLQVVGVLRCVAHTHMSLCVYTILQLYLPGRFSTYLLQRVTSNECTYHRVTITQLTLSCSYSKVANLYQY